MKPKIYDPLFILCRNGWDWKTTDDDWTDKDYFEYTNTFLGLYDAKVTAVVSCHQTHLDCHGYYGILWLDVSDYEFHNHCQKCGYKKYSNCKELLMCDMLYYLRMVLEKSEKGQTHRALYRIEQ